MSVTVSPKRKYTLLSSQVLKTEGSQRKSGRCINPTIELVQIRRGPVWTNSMVVVEHPYFSSSPLDFEYFALLQVYTFFWWRLYNLALVELRDIGELARKTNGLLILLNK